jgi:succinyl-CoA synthetase alpha subunit
MSGIKLIVCITEGIATIDMLEAKVKCDELGVGPDWPELPRRDWRAQGIMPGHSLRQAAGTVSPAP